MLPVHALVLNFPLVCHTLAKGMLHTEALYVSQHLCFILSTPMGPGSLYALRRRQFSKMEMSVPS